MTKINLEREAAFIAWTKGEMVKNKYTNTLVPLEEAKRKVAEVIVYDYDSGLLTRKEMDGIFAYIMEGTGKKLDDILFEYGFETCYHYFVTSTLPVTAKGLY